MTKFIRFLKKFTPIKLIIEKRHKFIFQRNQLKYKKTIAKSLVNGTLLKNVDRSTKDHWLPRIELVQESPDNTKIKHVANSATFNKDFNFILHNGLIMDPLSYYGLPVLEMLYKNKGVHEPEEEYAFQEILTKIPQNATMIELGAYWSFYSMWFHSVVHGAKNYMIEPEYLESGIKNFELNNMSGSFTKAFISDKSEKSAKESETPTICIDDFVSSKNIEFIDILHSDIQGFEYKMLRGAQNILDAKKIGYIFISTHSMELHQKCLEYLISKGFELVCSSDLEESYSWDGLLVFKNPEYLGFNKINISKRKSKKSEHII